MNTSAFSFTLKRFPDDKTVMQNCVPGSSSASTVTPLQRDCHLFVTIKTKTPS
jgi:hypothetical protein